MSERMSGNGLRTSWTSQSSMRIAPSWARLLSWTSGNSKKTPPSWALGTARRKNSVNTFADRNPPNRPESLIYWTGMYDAS